MGVSDACRSQEHPSLLPAATACHPHEGLRLRHRQPLILEGPLPAACRLPSALLQLPLIPMSPEPPPPGVHYGLGSCLSSMCPPPCWSPLGQLQPWQLPLIHVPPPCWSPLGLLQHQGGAGGTGRQAQAVAQKLKD